MKPFLYAMGCTMLIGSAAAMALLPALVTSLWVFGLAAAVLSMLNAAGWLTLSASAGNWPRPHAGPVLVLAGVAGGIWFLATGYFLGAAWNGVAILAGIPLWLARRRSRQAVAPRRAAPVKPPVSR